MRIIMLTLLVFNCFSADAQIDKFIQVTYGGGITNFILHPTSSGNAGDNISTKPFEVELGIQRKQFRLSVGIGTLKTGTKKLMTLENPGGSPNLIYKWYTEDYRHLVLPVSLGYQYNLSKKLAIVPSLGFMLSYNISKHTEIENISRRQRMSDEDFREQFQSMSVFGTAKIKAENKITKQLSINAGPAFAYMLSNMLIEPDGAPRKATQHNYALVFDVGVKWNLKTKTSEDKKPTDKVQ